MNLKDVKASLQVINHRGQYVIIVRLCIDDSWKEYKREFASNENEKNKIVRKWENACNVIDSVK